MAEIVNNLNIKTQILPFHFYGRIKMTVSVNLGVFADNSADVVTSLRCLSVFVNLGVFTDNLADAVDQLLINSMCTIFSIYIVACHLTRGAKLRWREDMGKRARIFHQ